MNQEERLANLRGAPRCKATTRARTDCQCPAVKGRMRCRLHGGHSPGAPKGTGNGNYNGGDFTAEAIKERQWLRTLVRTYGKLEK
jgi:hypothetical protein